MEARPQKQQKSTKTWSAGLKSLDIICTRESVKIFEQVTWSDLHIKINSAIA